MMNRPIVIVFFIFVGLGLSLIGASLFNQLACEGQPINNNVSPTQSQQIWGERSISQSFVAPHDNLDRIDILFQTYQRRNTHDVTFRLLEVPADNDNPMAGIELFKTTFNAVTLRDQSWHTFIFPAIAGSAGKTYLINLQSPEATDGNAITVGGIERNAYAAGTAFLGPIPVPADITFRACFQMGAGEKLQVFSEQITRNRPGLWGDIAFYIMTAIAYTILLIGFFWQLAKLPWEKTSGRF
jgi:hypothetical protein